MVIVWVLNKLIENNLMSSPSGARKVPKVQL
jgi:hypothetical protein